MADTGTLKIVGGAHIGGSCYLLEIHGVRILFDCGIKTGKTYKDHPEIPDPENIDAVFISHAHLDHMGAIAYAAAVCPRAQIFMTGQTKSFTEYQLRDTIAQYIGAGTEDLKHHNALLCKLVMNRITTVEFSRKYSFTAESGTEYRFTLFHAGHIPGAAMIYLKIKDRRILYTGDFSAAGTALTDPYSLPDCVRADTVILCGTNADKTSVSIRSDNVLTRIRTGLIAANCQSDIVVSVSNLTKGLELLSLVNTMIREGTLDSRHVFVEPLIWELAKNYFEDQSDTFRLPEYMSELSMAEWKKHSGRQMVFAQSRGNLARFGKHWCIDTDFTLHADHDSIAGLIRKASPSKVFVVHYPRTGDEEKALEAEFSTDHRTDIIYAEDGELYSI